VVGWCGLARSREDLPPVLSDGAEETVGNAGKHRPQR
jgi:hypothetical protein